MTNATSTYQTAAAGAHFLLFVNYGNVAMLQWLLIKDSALNQQDSNGWAALHFEAQAYAVETAALLLTADTTVNLPNAFGNNPLWRAAFESRGRSAMLQR